MNDTVGGPQQQVVLLSNGRSTRAKMTRIGTVRRDLFVMRTVDGTEFIAKKDDRGILQQQTMYELFEEIEGLSCALATIEFPKGTGIDQGSLYEIAREQRDFTPHIDHPSKPADEDYVRPVFGSETERTFL